MASIDLGDVVWAYDSTNKYFRGDISNVVSVGQYKMPNLLCSQYFPVLTCFGSDMANNPDKCITEWANDSNRIFIKDLSKTSADLDNGHASWLEGVILHYESVSGGTDYEAILYRKQTNTVKGITSLYWIKNPSWYHREGYDLFQIRVADSKPSTNIVTNIEASTSYVDSSSYINFEVVAGKYPTVDDFKNYVEDKTILYILATPQILDVTEYFPDENYRFIEVEGGGTITFKQTGDYKLAIPSVVEYDVKVGD